MKQDIQKLLEQVLDDLGVSGVQVEVVLSDRPEHGEFTTNIALRLAKQLKNSPMDIALQVKEVINGQLSVIRSGARHQNINQKDQTVSSKLSLPSILQDIERVEVAPPGFINFFLSESKLSTNLGEVLKMKEGYGTVQNQKSNFKNQKEKKNVIVEFTDPNPFKELHIGHLYSNTVGESLARLMEAMGHTVKRADYFGDVGMHVAKSLWGLKKTLIEKKTTLADLEKQPLPERIHLLGQSYALGATKYEEDKEVAEEMKDINYLVYVSGQEYLKNEHHWEPVVDYRKYIEGKDDQLAEIKTLFETGRRWSMEYFETMFRRLGTKFDYYYPESVVGEYGAKAVREHVGDVFEASDGAIIFRGEKYGLHTRVFINSLGLPTYEAKELGLALKKAMDFPYDLSLIVTGNEINEYFHVLMKALSLIQPELAARSRHIGHGMVRFPEGKMSSRTGKVLTGEWLLGEVKARIYDILSKSKSNYTKEEQDDIAEAATIAAVKYSFLKVALPAHLAFDFGKSLSFDGDSGPYLLYTYARCKSVVRKANEFGILKQEARSRKQEEKNNTLSYLNPEEHAVARLIFLYPEIVANAAQALAPNVLCTYLNELAQVFNLFYSKHSILANNEIRITNNDHNSQFAIRNSHVRLALTSATAQVLTNGLHLLGIRTVERM